MLKCLLLIHAYLAAANENSIALSIPSTPPNEASHRVSPSFAGFGIEPTSLFSYMGYDQPNPLSTNLLQNLLNYTGAPPHIRIGGNTQDNLYDETMTNWTWIWNPSANGRGQGKYKSDGILIGPRYFEAANRLLPGTPVTIGLNLAYEGDDYANRITAMAEKALDGTSNINIDITAFEIGNEPDLYAQNGFRDGSWSAQTYVEQWLDRATALYQQVLSPRKLSAAFFEAAATASTVSALGLEFQIKKLAGSTLGSDRNDAGSSYLRSWNQHDYYYFIGVTNSPITLAQLTQFQTTEAQFTGWAEQVQQAHDTSHPYALREMGIVGPVGLTGVTDVFGAALWTLNFLLYTASLGVESVQFHMTDNSAASAWQPIEIQGVQPFVRPVYYGVAAFAQTIGAIGCGARVWQYPPATISVPAGYTGYVRAYAVYDDNALSSIVVINGQPSNISISNKQSLDVQLQLPTSSVDQAIHLAYLTASGADATDGTTWNGLSYELSPDGTPTVVSQSDNALYVDKDGKATFSIRDTQAIVGTFGQKLGSGSRNAFNCGPDNSVPASSTGNSGSASNMTDNTPDDASAAAIMYLSPTQICGSSTVMLEVYLALLLGIFMLEVA
ncbi:glycoside hydrolase family 79 protein [Xylariaceae sp. FL1019]|nr:glycoside hydrolase family 79 protein [Xylariaceae sp. FL1019]